MLSPATRSSPCPLTFVTFVNINSVSEFKSIPEISVVTALVSVLLAFAGALNERLRPLLFVNEPVSCPSLSTNS